MKTKIAGTGTFLVALGLLIYAIFTTIIKNHWDKDMFIIICGSITLSVFAMLYIYWTNFGNLEQKMNSIQRQNKLIQSQIDFERIRKDIERKKLNK